MVVGLIAVLNPFSTVGDETRWVGKKGTGLIKRKNKL